MDITYPSGNRQSDQRGKRNFPSRIGAFALDLTCARINDEAIGFTAIFISGHPDRQQDVFERDIAQGCVDGMNALSVAADIKTNIPRNNAIHFFACFDKSLF